MMLRRPLSSRRRFRQVQQELRASRREAQAGLAKGGKPRDRSARELVASFFELAQGHRTAIIGVLAALTLSTAMALVPPAATKFLIDHVLGDVPVAESWPSWVPRDRLQMLLAICVVVLIASGIKMMVQTKGKKAVCALYQDTDFGEEIHRGAQDQTKAMNIPLVATATNKPTDSDFTAQIGKLRAANCDLVVMGTIVRDSVVPYITARKMGWTNVDFMGTSAAYINFVSNQPGNAMDGFYTLSGTIFPSRASAPANLVAWMDKYKTKYGSEPNVGVAYGYNAMDVVAKGIQNAGANLTVDTFIAGMEKINGYRDIFNGPTQSYGPNKRLGADLSYMFQVKGNEFVPISMDPVGY